MNTNKPLVLNEYLCCKIDIRNKFLLKTSSINSNYVKVKMIDFKRTLYFKDLGVYNYFFFTNEIEVITKSNSIDVFLLSNLRSESLNYKKMYF